MWWVSTRCKPVQSAPSRCLLKTCGTKHKAKRSNEQQKSSAVGLLPIRSGGEEHAKKSEEHLYAREVMRKSQRRRPRRRQGGRGAKENDRIGPDKTALYGILSTRRSERSEKRNQVRSGRLRQQAQGRRTSRPRAENGADLLHALIRQVGKPSVAVDFRLLLLSCASLLTVSPCHVHVEWIL